MKNQNEIDYKPQMNTDFSQIKNKIKLFEDYNHLDLTSGIINAAHKIHNTLGYGYLEKVYHNALILELRKRNYLIESEKQYDVKYDNKIVGQFFADIVVDNKVIIEVKAVDKYETLFEAQLLNYLSASGLEVGLILNFGRSVYVKRMVF